MGGSTASPLFVKLCGFFLNLAPSVDLGANRARQKFANSKAARQMNCVADVRRDILANYVDICTTTPAMKMVLRTLRPKSSTLTTTFVQRMSIDGSSGLPSSSSVTVPILDYLQRKFSSEKHRTDMQDRA